MSQSNWIRNNNRPEFSDDGEQTIRQATAERSVIFTRVLTGLGMSRQAQRFVWVIYTMAVPGEIYRASDQRIAENLGCSDAPTARNYVCNLRKKLKEWNAGTYNDHGKRHYSFVSIEENTYDYKAKKQNPTGYLFSKEFADLLETLHAKIRLHPIYKENWNRAINEVCGSSGADELAEYGFWKERKEKRPRTAEDILGTLLLNIKRLSRRFIDTAAEFGYDKAEAAARLKEILPGYINLAEYQTMSRGPLIRITGPGAPVVGYKPMMGKVTKKTTHTGPGVADTDQVHDGEGNFILDHIELRQGQKDFNLLFDKVFKYVSDRERKPQTILPVAYVSKSGKEINENDSCTTQRFIDNDGRGDPSENGSGAVKLVNREHIPILQTGKNNQSLDNSRMRFLERMQKSARNNSE